MAATTSDTNPPKSLYRALYTAILLRDEELIRKLEVISGHGHGRSQLGLWSTASDLARGAMPLALPNSCPCILTGIPLFPAAIAAVWLCIHHKIQSNRQKVKRTRGEERKKSYFQRMGNHWTEVKPSVPIAIHGRREVNLRIKCPRRNCCRRKMLRADNLAVAEAPLGLRVNLTPPSVVRDGLIRLGVKRGEARMVREYPRVNEPDHNVLPGPVESAAIGPHAGREPQELGRVGGQLLHLHVPLNVLHPGGAAEDLRLRTKPEQLRRRSVAASSEQASAGSVDLPAQGTCGRRIH